MQIHGIAQQFRRRVELAEAANRWIVPCQIGRSGPTKLDRHESATGKRATSWEGELQPSHRRSGGGGGGSGGSGGGGSGGGDGTEMSGGGTGDGTEVAGGGAGTATGREARLEGDQAEIEGDRAELVARSELAAATRAQWRLLDDSLRRVLVPWYASAP